MLSVRRPEFSEAVRGLLDLVQKRAKTGCKTPISEYRRHENLLPAAQNPSLSLVFSSGNLSNLLSPSSAHCGLRAVLMSYAPPSPGVPSVARVASNASLSPPSSPYPSPFAPAQRVIVATYRLPVSLSHLDAAFVGVQNAGLVSAVRSLKDEGELLKMCAALTCHSHVL